MGRDQQSPTLPGNDVDEDELFVSDGTLPEYLVQQLRDAELLRRGDPEVLRRRLGSASPGPAAMASAPLPGARS